MPENASFLPPALRVCIDGIEVSWRQQITSVRTVSTAKHDECVASIEVLEGDRFVVPTLGTRFTVSLGFGKELPWSKTYELDAIRLAGLPNLFRLSGRERGGRNGSKATSVGADRVPFEAKLGLNIVSFSVTQTQNSQNQKGHSWEGSFTMAGEPNLSIGDPVTFTGFSSFLDGQFRVRSVFHSFDANGFGTIFTVEGQTKRH